MPEAASCSPIHALFVSTIWPSNNSVPIARTSHRIGSVRPLPVDVAPAQDLQARRDGEHDGDPENDFLEAAVVGRPRQQHEADRAILRERLVLAELLRG